MRNKDDRGGAFIELLLVLPILFIMLAAGFEISRSIRYKNAAIQLSHQAASEVFRECSTERAILMSDCVTRIQREMTRVAMQISPDVNNNQGVNTGASHVAITVYFNNNGKRVQYTARADQSEYLGETNFHVNYTEGRKEGQLIGIQIDDWNAINKNIELRGRTFETPPAQKLLDSFGVVVVAQAYIKYKPSSLLIGGGRLIPGNYISDYTIL